MTGPDPSCPYLHCETIGFRPLTGLAEPVAPVVVHTWSCRHPFHGIELELGGDWGTVVRRCAVCGLPHEAGDQASSDAARRQEAPPRADTSSEGAA